jgi:hypothetical protein
VEGLDRVDIFPLLQCSSRLGNLVDENRTVGHSLHPKYNSNFLGIWMIFDTPIEYSDGYRDYRYSSR